MKPLQSSVTFSTVKRIHPRSGGAADARTRSARSASGERRAQPAKPSAPRMTRRATSARKKHVALGHPVRTGPGLANQACAPNVHLPRGKELPVPPREKLFCSCASKKKMQLIKTPRVSMRRVSPSEVTALRIVFLATLPWLGKKRK